MTRYPNLLELHNHHPYGEPAMCDHAGIELELLNAVLEGGELLESAEIMGLARLYGIPRGLLESQKVTMLNMKRWKHRKMAAEVDSLYMRLKWMARTGNAEAEKYLKWADLDQQRFMRAAYDNNLSYCHYFGVRERLSQYVSFATPKPKRRGVLRERKVVLPYLTEGITRI
jgi:hypothetical protein